MIKKLTRLSLPLAALILMLGITAAIILYREGYYDIAFIERPEDTTEKTAEVTEAQTPQDTTASKPVTEPSDDGNTDAVSSDVVTEPSSGEAAADTSGEGPSASEFISSLKTVSYQEKRGYDRTDADYTSSQRFALMELAVTPKKRLSLSTGTRTANIFNDETDVLEKVTTSYDRPVLELYMGMIFYDDGKTVGLLDDYGNLAMVGFEGMEFAYERDAYDRPLIMANGSYYYISDKWQLVYSDFNPAFSAPIRYDSQLGYNEANCGLYPFYVEKRVQYIANYERMYKMEHQLQRIIEPEYAEDTFRIYGYMDERGNVVIEPQYYYAYNFGPEGYAVVADRDRVMKIIDTRGRTVVDPSGTIVRAAELNNRNAIIGYYLPASDTIDALGSFYFDHGLTRVRLEMRDYFDIGQIVGDTDLLIYADGSEFPMPEGYDLVSYSDGVLLLEREGRYGCMDYTGRWIAQPIYTYAEPFSEGLCVLGTSDGKRGMIDTEGDIIIPFAFDHISSASGGRIALFESSLGWNVIEKTAR